MIIMDSDLLLFAPLYLALGFAFLVPWVLNRIDRPLWIGGAIMLGITAIGWGAYAMALWSEVIATQGAAELWMFWLLLWSGPCLLVGIALLGTAFRRHVPERKRFSQ
jgi:hypothetical protein